MIAKRRVFLVIVAWILAFSMCATAFATGGADADAPAEPAAPAAEPAVVTVSISEAQPSEAAAPPAGSADQGPVAADPADTPADPDDPEAGVEPVAPDAGNLSGDGYNTDSGFEVSQNENQDDSAEGAVAVQDDTVIVTPDGDTVIVNPDGEIVDENGNATPEAEQAANDAGVYDQDGYIGEDSVLTTLALNSENEADKEMVEKLLAAIGGGVTEDDLIGASAEEIENLFKEAYPENYDAVMSSLLASVNSIEMDGVQDVELTSNEELLEILSVVLGDITLDVNKTASVPAVAVYDENGNLITDAYEITLTAEGEGGLDVLAALGGEVVGNGAGTKDIILVLDGSGSMEWGIDGQNDKNGEQRWEVLRQSVNSFIDTLTENGVNAQITVVMYSENAGTLGTFDISKDEQGNAPGLDELMSYFKQGTTRETVRKGIVDHGYQGYSEAHQSEAAIHAAEVIGVKDPAEFAATFDVNPESSGTNTDAGYREATAAIQRLQAAGEIDGNVSVVFMTDGQANHYVGKNGNVDVDDGHADATNAASDAIMELLTQNGGNVTLHNVALTGADERDEIYDKISAYMDPDYTGNPYGGSYKTLNAKLNDPENGVDYSIASHARELVWATNKDEMMDAYKGIAQNIALQISEAARVAKEAYVIDVIPAGFEVRIDPADADKLILVGTDAEGNTIIQWNVGDIIAGADPEKISYFVIPKDDTQYGTLFTNDSAILFAKPLGSDEEVAIVMPRPAVSIQPDADPDVAGIYYGEANVGNLMEGNFNIEGGKDSSGADRVQALGTEVDGAFEVVEISNVRIDVGAGEEQLDDASIVKNEEDGSFTVDLGEDRGTVTIDKDGNVRYIPAPGKEWDPAWAGIKIDFDYAIRALGKDSADRMLDDMDGMLSFDANSTATIMISAPATPVDDDDPYVPPTNPPGGGTDPTPTPNPGGGEPGEEPIPLGVPGAEGAEPIPLGVPNEPIPLGAPVEPIPLGVPGTGGMSMTPIAIVALLLAMSLTGWAIMSKKREEN